MKRYGLCVIFLAILLTACMNKEDRIGEVAKEDLAKLYHLEDVEVVSVDYNKPPGPFIVFGLDYLFNGKDYDVVLQVNERYPVNVEAQINGRAKELKNDNYVSAKHETMLKNNDDYQQIVKQLSESGIEISQVYDRYFTDTVRSVRFDLELDQTGMSAEELIDKLTQLSNLLLEHNETVISPKLSVNTKDIFVGEVRDNLIEIEVAPYEEADDKAFIQILREQLKAINAVQSVDEVFKDRLEDYFLSVSLSRLNHLLPTEVDNRHNKIVVHEMWMEALPGYTEEDLLEAFYLLQEEAYNETYIQLEFGEGYTDYCQVKEIQTINDIERCYTHILNE